MTVKEFLKRIDLETINSQEITIIIPVNEKAVNGVVKENGSDCTMKDDEGAVFDCSEYAFNENEKYEYYGIEPVFKDEENDIIDVRYTDDDYRYVYNEDGEVWIVVT
jgi:hypothetical protein